MGTDEVMQKALELARARLGTFKVMSNNTKNQKHVDRAKKDVHKATTQTDRRDKEVAAA